MATDPKTIRALERIQQHLKEINKDMDTLVRHTGQQKRLPSEHKG